MGNGAVGSETDQPEMLDEPVKQSVQKKKAPIQHSDSLLEAAIAGSQKVSNDSAKEPEAKVSAAQEKYVAPPVVEKQPSTPRITKEISFPSTEVKEVAESKEDLVKTKEKSLKFAETDEGQQNHADDSQMSEPKQPSTAATSATQPKQAKEKDVAEKSKDKETVKSTSSGNNSKASKKVTIQQTEDDDDKRSAVSDVSGSEDLEPVEVLQQYIPYYNQGDPANDSIVRSALSGLSVEDIDSKDEYGNTLLLLACQYRCEDLVRIMLNKGADPNAVNTSGACGLHFACYRDSSSYPIAKILLTNGANPDIAETSYGCCPLHYAAGNGDLNFCKLLLSYGASIAAYDYYNYTCVDYAREGGFEELAAFLQVKFDKATAQSNFRGGAGGGGGGGSGGYGSNNHNSCFSNSNRYNNNSNNNNNNSSNNGYDDMSQWESHYDPDSGSKYFINLRTGECLWESELKAKMTTFNNNNFNNGNSFRPSTAAAVAANNKNRSPANAAAGSNSSSANSEQAKKMEAILIQQATQTRLISFLSKHDPTRLSEIDALIAEFQGREPALLNMLCQRYKVNEDPEVQAWQLKLNELKGNFLPPVENNNNDSIISASMKSPKQMGVAQVLTLDEGTSSKINNNSNSNAAVDPLVLQELAQEARKKLEQQFDEEKSQLRNKHTQQLDEERKQHRQLLSEKEGETSKLQSEVESLTRQIATFHEEINGYKAKITALQSSGGEALNLANSELQAAVDEVSRLKTEIATFQRELTVETEKRKSLEQTLLSLTAGHEERVAMEQKASAERAEQQRQREEAHAKELQSAEERLRSTTMRLKSELNQAKSDWIKQESTLKQEFNTMKTQREQEIETLRQELAERKAQFATEISAALMQLEDSKRGLQEATIRAEEAEAFQRTVQAELAEAKIVQKFNAQLHKDLAREQLQRKKLHNEMEDMKGRIRVYVRVRPFSQTELARPDRQEAVFKDGKMSVVVKGITGGVGSDQRKTYDFDQVFGGAATAVDGNSQADVFKDTKHLIMSVIDGYNVCIFAYGQTGAGKSYTMIGGCPDIGSCLSEQGDFDEQAGITPRAVAELFRLLNERTAQVEYTVEVQMFQLYRDGLEDLLKKEPVKDKNNKKNSNNNDKEIKDPPLKITLAEHSSTGLVQVEGAETIVAANPVEVMRIFARGSSRRTTASTMMNAESSRSHLICALVVRLSNRRTGQQSVGKLTLVDLAGSERVDKSGATGEQLKEAQSINKSLSALGDVIAALTSQQQHVPYRNHPLTMLMSDSIGGNAKTLMFVNCSPADYNAAESNNSLAFASRCKDVTNMVSAAAPGVQAAQVNALRKELAKLKKGAAAGAAAGGGGGPSGGAAGKAGGPGGVTTAPPPVALARPDTAAQNGQPGAR